MSSFLDLLIIAIAILPTPRALHMVFAYPDLPIVDTQIMLRMIYWTAFFGMQSLIVLFFIYILVVLRNLYSRYFYPTTYRLLSLLVAWLLFEPPLDHRIRIRPQGAWRFRPQIH